MPNPRNEFCERLGSDWRPLATELNIPQARVDLWQKGTEAHEILRYLDDLKRWPALENALREIDRTDLVPVASHTSVRPTDHFSAVDEVQPDTLDVGQTIEMDKESGFQPMKNTTVTAAAWLLMKAKQMPLMWYAAAAAGLVAAVALGFGFSDKQWPLAIIGGVATLTGMFVLKLLASLTPTSQPINVTPQTQILLWSSVLCIIIIQAMGLVKLGGHLFASANPFPSAQTTHTHSENNSIPQAEPRFTIEESRPDMLKEQ